MITLFGRRHRFCDGVSRRSFLKIGGLAMGGLALPDLLRAEAAAGRRSSHKAVIMVFMSGGPPHQDTFDLKMDAPAEIRGEFKPISTNVPGVQICELLPRMAAMMDRLAIIRSVVGSEGRHAAFQCMTGRSVNGQPTGGGLRTGQAIGSTNRLGEHPKDRPVHFQEVFATLYHNLGIDVHSATVPDRTGRPHYLVDHSLYSPLPELI